MLLTVIGLLFFAPAIRTGAQTFTNLHSFIASEGSMPAATLVLSDDTLYGTATKAGGKTNGSGSVFRMNTDGTGFTVLQSFTRAMDGANPYGNLVLMGNTLYGPAYFGGTANAGVIYAVNTDGTGFRSIYNFPQTTRNFPFANSAGSFPQSGLVSVGDTLYGLCSGGGIKGWGTIFSLGATGNVFTNLHNFGLADGQSPSAPLILSDNILYGTTADGGANGSGAIFRMNVNGTGFTILYNFTSSSGSGTNSDGAAPLGSLVLDVNVLYGTTSSGGRNANGTIFKINTDGRSFACLYHFSAKSGPLQVNDDGANPQSGLLLYNNALYGTAMNGGSHGSGTVFRMELDGSDFSTLHNFSATNFVTGVNNDGAHPIGGLVSSVNALYGTTSLGGAKGCGAIFGLVFPPSLYYARVETNAIVIWPTNATIFTLDPPRLKPPPQSIASAPAKAL